ncbi:hypothetical protein AAVH_36434 [Aphelenchoides avenae]|nr:hypothetical protein AAVH_36434 [Aphelenchus avenae]
MGHKPLPLALSGGCVHKDGEVASLSPIPRIRFWQQKLDEELLPLGLDRLSFHLHNSFCLRGDAEDVRKQVTNWIGYRQETGEAWGEWMVSDIAPDKLLRLSSLNGNYPAIIKRRKDGSLLVHIEGAISCFSFALISFALKANGVVVHAHFIRAVNGYEKDGLISGGWIPHFLDSTDEYARLRIQIHGFYHLAELESRLERIAKLFEELEKATAESLDDRLL